MPELSTPFLSISFTKAIENTLGEFNRKMSGKGVFSINNHTLLLVYRISIIRFDTLTIRLDLIDKVKMSIYRFVDYR